MFALIQRTGYALRGHGCYWAARVLAVIAMLVASIAVAATPPGTTITNTAQVQWTVGATTSTVSAQHQITVSAAGSDLALTLTGPAQAAPGSSIVWRVVATNIGPLAADGAQVTATLPPGVTGISGVCVVLTSGTCGAVTVGVPTPAGTPVTITLSTFPVGGRVEITLRGTAPATAGTINTQAQVSLTGVIDPTPTNNVATVPTQIVAGAATTGTLSGRVWLDANHDRAFNSGERLLPGFTVRVYDATGTSVVNQVATDANGAYS